ncbi:Hpt domain-containing protein (plasmid) [Catenovulum sp. SX2]|uniref:Hpt domain-containing protein n=1 Tax=Catenovulum sp. SX2 TaxID=3398614 RepID=UPI003F836428
MTTSQHEYFSEQIIQPLVEELGADVFAELIKVYLTECEQLIAQLNQQINQTKSIDEITRLAHSIKSSSKSYGAIAVAEISWQIEQDAKQNYQNNMQSLLHRLEHCYTHTQQYARKTWLT